MNEPEEEFATLLKRVSRDDAEALSALVALYEPAVRRAAEMLLGNTLRAAIDATDLVQSVHLAMMSVIRRRTLAVDSPARLRSLAVTLLRHEYIAQWRRHRRVCRHQAAIALSIALGRGPGSARLAELDPAQAVEFRDLLEHLAGRLRDDDRRLIFMRLHGYRTREIATELGIEPVAVRMRLSRLRQRLRRGNLPEGRT